MDLKVFYIHLDGDEHERYGLHSAYHTVTLPHLGSTECLIEFEGTTVWEGRCNEIPEWISFLTIFHEKFGTYTALEQCGACQDALDWLSDKSIDSAWQSCENGFWMIYILYYVMLIPESEYDSTDTLSPVTRANIVRTIFPTWQDVMKKAKVFHG